MSSSTKSKASRRAKPTVPSFSSSEFGLKVSLQVITPERAAKVLATQNTHNRRLRPSKVEQYVRDMQTGNWNIGSSIAFSKDKVLLDGQNRLSAIVQSGQSQPLIVIEGLPMQSQTTMDTGAGRTFADVLDISGHDPFLASLIASSVSWCMRYERGAVGSRSMNTNDKTGKNLSHSEQLAWLEANKGLRDVVLWVKQLNVSARKGISKTMLVGLIYMAKGLEQEAMDFVEAYATGVGLEEGDPALQLSRLVDKLHNSPTKKASTAYYNGVLIKSFNYHAEGRKVKHLRFVYDGNNRKKLKTREKFPTILTADDLG